MPVVDAVLWKPLTSDYGRKVNDARLMFREEPEGFWTPYSTVVYPYGQKHPGIEHVLSQIRRRD